MRSGFVRGTSAPRVTRFDGLSGDFATTFGRQLLRMGLTALQSTKFAQCHSIGILSVRLDGSVLNIARRYVANELGSLV